MKIKITNNVRSTNLQPWYSWFAAKTRRVRMKETGTCRWGAYIMPVASVGLHSTLLSVANVDVPVRVGGSIN